MSEPLWTLDAIVAAMNAERRGALVGLIITRGFRQILHLAEAWTPGPLFGFMVYEKPEPLTDTFDGDRADLLRLRLRVPMEPGLGGQQQGVRPGGPFRVGDGPGDHDVDSVIPQQADDGVRAVR